VVAAQVEEVLMPAAGPQEVAQVVVVALMLVQY